MNKRKTKKTFFIKIGRWSIGLILLSVLFVSQNVLAAPGEINGTVFRDYNANGVRDAGEPGVAGITITAYDANGIAAASNATDSSGAYSLTGLLDGAEYRLEMTNLPSYLQPAPIGADSAGSVVFITSPLDDVLFGVFNPADYCQSNPTLTTPCHVNGDPTGPTGSPNNTSTFSFLYSIPYNASGTGSNTALADGSDIGATYGLAYQRSTNQLFASAMMKRHVGYGPDGNGAIYLIDDPTGTPTPSLFVDLDVLLTGTSFGLTSHTSLPVQADQPSHDAGSGNPDDVFDAVGKESFGDMDISEDERTLYLVDLYNRALLSIFVDLPAQVPQASDVTSHSIPDPGCTNGGYRPFGLKVHDGLVYVGIVCDQFGATASDPDAFVYSFDPGTTNFNQVFSMDMQYPRGSVSVDGGNTASANWLPWIDEWNDIHVLSTSLPFGKQVTHPQAILSDIEFDDDGSMILGFLDRFGHQSGAANYSTDTSDTTRYEGVAAGDLIKVCLVAGTYTLESNGTCGSDSTSGAGNAQGPGGGEFYWQDMHTQSGTSTDGLHHETTIGSLSMLRGEPEVAVTIWDPLNTIMAGGIGWYDNSDGTRPRNYQIYNTTPLNNTNPTFFGKANGLGDLEVLCDPAPLELGNRIWEDADSDGIQDPGEYGIPGVIVQLWADLDGNGSIDAQVAQTTSDANGNYLFSRQGTNALGQAEDWLYPPTPDEVEILTAYEIRIVMSQTAVGGRPLTTVNAPQPANMNAAATDNDPITDVADSDATLVSGAGVIAVTTSGAGNNNHGLDFGMIPYDWGDLPDSFDTTASTGGARHLFSTDLYLGSCTDSETNGQPDPAAGSAGFNTGLGDDGNPLAAAQATTLGSCTDAGDDEDGVTLETPLIAGAQACVNVTAVNTTGSNANLYGWVDFNGDGDFDGDAIELLSTGDFTGGSATVAGSGSGTYCFNVPAGATFDGGETHMRFRLTSDTLGGGTPWGGAATDGEVEDYHSQLACVGNYVWNDDTGTTPNVQDASDTALSGIAMRLVWAGPDGIINSTPSDSTPVGDDVYYPATTNASGVYSYCGLTPEGTDAYRIDLPSPPGSTPLAVPPGVGGNPNRDSNGNQGALGDPITTGPFTINDPVSLPTGEDGNQDNPGGNNNYPDDQDDLAFDFGLIPLYPDRGDLPDSFDTLTASNGPSHDMTSDLLLGSCVDADANGQPDPIAGAGGAAGNMGDDGNTGAPVYGTCTDAGDDEDGIALVTPLIAGNQACVSVTAVNTTGSDANLYGWVDFNGDGDFDGDANELLTTGDFSGGAATVSASGTANYCFNVPAGATFDGGETHMRFRLTSDTLSGPTPWGGSANDGEIEDYYNQLACAGNYVWNDSTGSTPDVQDGTDTPLSGVAMRLVWAGPDGVIDTTNPGAATPANDDVFYTAVTDVNGVYSFCGLISQPGNTYRIDMPSPPGAYPVAVTPNVGGNANQDSNGTQTLFGGPISSTPFNINDPINLPTGENGNQDNRINNFPDNRDDIAFDFGLEAYTLDRGDLLDSFQTLSANNGPSHVVSSVLRMGDCVDADADGLPDSQAGMLGNNGDDGNTGTDIQGSCAAAGDDEDGLTVPFLVSGSPIDLNVQVEYPASAPAPESIISGDAYVGGWTETAQGCSSTAGGGGRQFACFGGNVGIDIVKPGGFDTLQYCELNVNVSANGFGGQFNVNLDGTPIGTVPDAIGSYQITFASQSFNAINFRTNGGFGAYFGTIDSMTLSCSSAIAPDATLAGWYDSTADGDFADAGDVIPNATVSSGTSGDVTIQIPTISGTVLNEQLGCRTSLRLRLSTDMTDSPGLWYNGGQPNPTGFATDGEVEDYVLTCDGFEADYGDHHEATDYDTLLVSDGPRHYHASQPSNYLGSCIDLETDGQHTSGADGDDALSGNHYGICNPGDDDEDGVGMSDLKWGDGQGSVEVNVTGNGCVVAWADWNGDGRFTGSINDGTTDVNEFLFAVDMSSVSNPNIQTFAAPLSAGDGGIYNYPATVNTRYRLFADTCANLGGPAAVESRSVGNAVGGEVEDYQWGFNPTAVTLNAFTADNSSSVTISFVVLIGLVLIGGSVFLMLRRKYSVG